MWTVVCREWRRRRDRVGDEKEMVVRCREWGGPGAGKERPKKGRLKGVEDEVNELWEVRGRQEEEEEDNIRHDRKEEKLKERKEEG